MSNQIRTFSGAHPYRPQCVIETARTIFVAALGTTVADDFAVSCAARITTAVDAGICPRCSDPLRPEAAPEWWSPAGSRTTRCRCIPICETCAGWAEPVLGPIAVTSWPTDEDEGEDLTRKEYEAALIEQARAQAKAAVLDVGPASTVLVTTEGVAPCEVQPRPHPGGWLEFGFDDTDDRRERQS